jgi:hypothetical protein
MAPLVDERDIIDQLAVYSNLEEQLEQAQELFQRPDVSRVAVFMQKGRVYIPYVIKEHDDGYEIGPGIYFHAVRTLDGPLTMDRLERIAAEGFLAGMNGLQHSPNAHIMEEDRSGNAYDFRYGTRVSMMNRSEQTTEYIGLAIKRGVMNRSDERYAAVGAHPRPIFTGKREMRIEVGVTKNMTFYIVLDPDTRAVHEKRKAVYRSILPDPVFLIKRVRVHR